MSVDELKALTGGSPRWQVVSGRSKQKREGPTVGLKPRVLPPPSPASPNLEPLVIVEEDPDPKVLRTHSDPDKGWLNACICNFSFITQGIIYFCSL